jgi:hypothetical protein
MNIFKIIHIQNKKFRYPKKPNEKPKTRHKPKIWKEKPKMAENYTAVYELGHKKERSCAARRSAAT